MPNQQSKAHSAVSRIAQDLRAVALCSAEGEYIGSEESLARKYDTTGPTLRQAIRLLEHEELVSVKRGVGGGYFARRPDLDTISRVAAVYLQGNPHVFEDIEVFLEFIQPLLVDLVLKSDRLDEFVPYADPGSAASSYPEFVEQQSTFTDLLFDLSNNAPLQLIYRIFFQVGKRAPIELAGELSEGVLAVQEMRIALARALLDRDREKAIEVAISICRTVGKGIRGLKFEPSGPA